MSHGTLQRLVGALQIVGGAAEMFYGGGYGGGGGGSLIGSGIQNLAGEKGGSFNKPGGFGADLLGSFGLGALDKNQSTGAKYGSAIGGLAGGLSSMYSGGSGMSGGIGSLFGGGGSSAAGSAAPALEAGSGSFGSPGYGVLQSSGDSGLAGFGSGMGDGAYGTPGYGVMMGSEGPSTGGALSNLGVGDDMSQNPGMMQGLGSFLKSPLGKQLLGSMLGGGDQQGQQPSQIPFLPVPQGMQLQAPSQSLPPPPAISGYQAPQSQQSDLIGQQKLPQVAGQKSADENLREALMLWQMTKGQPQGYRA